MPALIAALTSAQPENINMLSMTANMQRSFFSIRPPYSKPDPIKPLYSKKTATLFLELP